MTERAALGVLVLLLIAQQGMRGAGTPAGTVLTNQASVTCRYAGRPSPLTILSNTTSVTVMQVAVVNLSPASAGGPARLNTAVDYAFTATNSGNGTDRFTCTAVSSLGLFAAIYVDGNGDGVLSPAELGAGPLTVTSDLTADASVHLIVRLTIPDDASLAGKTDALTIQAVSVFDPGEKGVALRSTTMVMADVRTVKAVAPTIAKAGDRVVYTITYENRGNGDAAGVVWSDVLDPRLRYVTGSSVPAPDSVSTQTLTWNLGAIAAGSTGAISFQVEIANNIVTGSEIHNSMTCRFGDGPTPRTVTSVETNFITIQSGGPVTVDISPARAGSGEPGDTVQYAFVITNNGALPEAFDLSFVSTRGVSWTVYRDSSGTGHIAPGQPSITSTGPVPSGGTVPIVSRAVLPLVAADQTQDVTTFRVRSTQNTENTKTTAATTTIAIPHLSLVKTVLPAQARPGDEATYAITYTNTGHGHAYEFVLTDSIPAGTLYVPNTVTIDGVPKTDPDDQDVVTVAGNKLTVRLGTIPPRSGGVIEFRVKVL